jgi:hypothetical protein
MIEISDRPYFELAAGTYLANFPSEEWYKWEASSDARALEWLEANVCEAMEDWSGEMLLQAILDHAASIRLFVTARFNTQDVEEGEYWYMKLKGTDPLVPARVIRLSDRIVTVEDGDESRSYQRCDVTFIERIPKKDAKQE